MVNACDTTVVVLVPESGDSVQAMKAGLMEIADIFVVNKADREGAQRIVGELDMILDIRRKQGGCEYPVISTQAVNNKGIDLLLSKVFEHKEFIVENHHFDRHRKAQIKTEIRKIIELRVKDIIGEKILVSLDLDAIVEKIFNREDDPYSVGERILRGVKITNSRQ